MGGVKATLCNYLYRQGLMASVAKIRVMLHLWCACMFHIGTVRCEPASYPIVSALKKKLTGNHRFPTICPTIRLSSSPEYARSRAYPDRAELLLSTLQHTRTIASLGRCACAFVMSPRAHGSGRSSWRRAGDPRISAGRCATGHRGGIMASGADPAAQIPIGMARKLAAILSADVVGYSRLMGDDEEATIHTLKRYREVLGTIVEQHRGRVVDSPGDNLLAEFPSVVEAVQGAVT